MCARVDVRVCVRARACVCVRVRACARACARVCVCVCVCVCLNTEPDPKTSEFRSCVKVDGDDHPRLSPLKVLMVVSVDLRHHLNLNARTYCHTDWREGH